MKKITQFLFLLFFVGFSYSQSPTCAGASAICSGNIAPFPNTTGVSTIGSPGCLGSAPNPAWFYFQVGLSGNLIFTLNQGDNAPAYNNQDVDFIVWGPFNAPNCTDLYDFNAAATVNNIVDCSFSGAAVETVTIPNAIAGQFYMLLVTNYSDDPGFIEMNQTNAGNAGAGSTNCDIVCGVHLGNDQFYCSTTISTHILTATFNQAPTLPGTPVYSWYLGGVLQTTTTVNTLSVNQSGIWSVQVIRPGCSDTATDSVEIRFDSPPTLNSPPSPINIGCGPYDLTSLIPAMVAPEPASDFVVYFYTDVVDCWDGNSNFIPTPTAYSPTVNTDVYIRVENIGNPTCNNTDEYVSLIYDCSVGPVNISANTICSGTTGTVNFTGTPNAVVTYTVDGGANQTVTLDGSGNASVTTPVLSSNSVYTLVSVFNGSVTTPISGSATVTVLPLPTAAISGATAICSGTTAVVNFTGTAGATVTYTVDGGANQTITLNASGNASVTTPVLTANSTYSLVSVSSATTPVCNNTASGSVTITVNALPTASVTANTICSGATGTVSFTGTPNAVVTYSVDGGANQTITLDASGNASVTTPVLTVNSTYTLVSVATTVAPICTQAQTASATVIITALPTVAISGSTTICSGATAVISFTGTAGAVVTYTVDGGANQTVTLNASGSASVTTPALSANSVYTLVSVNGACTNTASGSATVTVLPLPTAAISGATAICSGTTAVVNFTGTAGATVTYTIDGGANQTITLNASGNASVTTPVLTANSTYSLVSVSSATTPVCNNTASGSVTITVNALPTASVTANTICSGATGTVSFTGTPNAVVTYSVDGGANQTITLDASGNASVTTPVLTVNSTYTLVSVATTVAPICAQAQTASATVIITALPTAAISGSTTICSGATAVISFTGTAGAVVTYTVDGGANQTVTLNASGSASVTTPALSANSVYTLVSVNGACTNTASGSATVTVLPLPTAAISGATAICSGTTAVVNFTGTAGATVTYTIDGGANQTITLNASGNASVTTPVLTANSTYSLVSVSSATTPVCNNTVSGSVTITVNALPTASVTANTICSGATGTVSFTGTPNAVVTYSVDGGANQTITLDASGNASVTTPVLTVNSTYTLVSVATTVAPICTQAQTASATVTITALPTAAISGSTTICSGATAVISFTGTPNAVVTYTVDGGANQTVTLDGSGNASVTTPALSANSVYTLVSVNGACTNTASGSATVTVLPLPTAAISGTTAICSGTTAVVNFTGTAGATVTYTIDGGANQTITLNASGNASVTTPVLTANSTYNLVSVSSATTPVCNNTASGSVTITVNALPTASVTANTICSGATGTVSFTGTPNAVVTYSVDGGANQTITLDASGNASVTTPVLTVNSTYTLVSVATTVAPICTQAQTASATVIITTLPTVAISGSTTICSGATAVISFTGTAGAVVTYTVDGGANQTVTLNASGNASVTTPALSANSVYTLVSVTATTTPACTNTASGSATVTVLPLPTAAISGATAICSGTTAVVNFTGTAGATITYTVDGGANQTITLNASGNASVTTPVLTANSTYSLVSVSSATTPVCNNTASGSVTITVNQPPVATATPASDTICSSSTTNIALSSTEANTTYSWTVVQTNVTGASSDSGNNISQTLSTVGGAFGNVIYTITPTANGCVGLPITVQVNVSPKPDVIITGNATYCDGDTTSLTLTSTVPGTTFSWNVISYNVDGTQVVSGTGNTINQLLDLDNPQNVGTVTYNVTPYFTSGCAGDSQQIEIKVNPIPDVVAAATSTSICSGDTAHVDMTSAISGVTYTWTVVSTGVNGASNGSGTSIDQVLTTSNPLVDGFVVYTITPSLNGCVGASATVQIDVKARPEFFGTISNPVICSGETTNINLSASIPGTNFIWTVVTTNVSGASDGTGSNIAQTLTSTLGGTAVYTIVPELNGCSGAPIQVTVIVNPLPQPKLEDGTLCIDKATGIAYQYYTLDTGLVATGYSFDWYLDGVLIPGANEPTYVAQVVGVYSVIVTNIATTCESEEVFATVDFVYPETAFTTIVTDAFSDSATVTITVAGDGTGSLLYQLDEGALQSSNVFTGVSAGPHTVTVVDTEGCTFIQQSVLVIDYPKYFTPNGDGHNDTWNIVGLDQADAKLYIFDRYGKLIKQLSATAGSQGWDGTYNGELLPSTDYWFSIDYTENGAVKQFKAHFSMKR